MNDLLELLRDLEKAIEELIGSLKKVEKLHNKYCLAFMRIQKTAEFNSLSKKYGEEEKTHTFSETEHIKKVILEATRMKSE